MNSTLKQLRFLRRSAMIESCTLLVLVCVAVPLKHLGGYGGMVSVMGPVHGAAFIYYLWSIARVAPEIGLTRAEVGILLAGAILPLGAWWSMRVIAGRDA